MGALIRLNLRLSRISNAAWMVGILAFLAIGPPAFDAYLPTSQERHALVEQMNMGAAMTVIYGPIQKPGTLGQLIMWEIGAFLMVIGAIWMIMYGTRIGRGEEDTGGSEFVAALGYTGQRRTIAALSAITILSILTGGIATVILVGFGHKYEELPSEGAVAFGIFFALLLCAVGTGAIFLGQVMPTVGSARSFSFGILGLAFVLRAVASVNDDFAWLRWLSYLGWLDLITPYTDNDLLVIVPLAAVATVIGAGAVYISGRRDFATGVIKEWDRARRLRSVGTLRKLTAITDRGIRQGWWAGILAMALFVGSAVTLVVTMIDEQDGIRQMMEAFLEEDVALEETFTEVFALIIVVLIFAYVAQIVLKAATSEIKGLNELIVATGKRRNAILLQRIVNASNQGLLVTVISALLYALSVYGTTDSIAYATNAGWAVIYHVPGVIAVIGLTALIVGILPRWRHIVWIIPIYTWVVSYYGPLLQVPEWMDKTSILYWGEMSEPHVVAWIALIAIGIGGSFVGLTAANRRDQARS